MIEEKSNLSDEQLEAAIWYVKHKALLRQIVIGLILAVDVATVGYVLFGVGKDITLFGKRREMETELLHMNISAAAVIGEGQRPINLQLGGVSLLYGGDATDIVARVQNPNPEWYATFDYTIGLGENVVKGQDGFLLPGEERPFVQTIKGGGGTTVFNIENVSWRRIGPQIAPDVQKWRDEHLNFEISDNIFLPVTLENGKSLGRAQFNIKNSTAYGYVEPKFLVLLYRGSRLMGAQVVVLDSFKALEKREIKVSWLDNIGAISEIEVVPVIDIMNQAVYLK